MPGTPPDADAPDPAADFVERRQGPGQRASDIERQLVESAVAIAKRGPKATAIIVGIGGAIGSVLTFLLMVFGLRIGGAADLSALRSDVLRRDSAAEHWRATTDSVTRGNALRIAHLEEADRFKMFILCNIAEQVGARSGGMCQGITSPSGRP